MRRERKERSSRRERSNKEAKRTILIVDDQMENIRPFKMSFRKEFRVLTAMSGNEAIDILEKEEVDLVVTDHNMPQMTGIELLTFVEHRYPGVPKMLLTGNTDLEYLKKGISQINCEKIVMKPYDRESLLAVFWKILSVKEEVYMVA